MANVTGVRRIGELIDKYGLDLVTLYARGLMDYSERIMRQTIREIPDGEYRFEDAMEDDGIGKNRGSPLPRRW